MARVARTPAMTGMVTNMASSLATASALVLVLLVGGCDAPGLPDINAVATNVPPPPPPASDPAKLRAYTDDMAARYAAHPDDRAIAVRYAAALREQTRFAQAVAVLQQSAIHHPQDPAVLGAYGKALADAGRLQEAADVLSRSHTPDRPNWAILSAQGSVADQMGQHADAQNYYATALKIAPNQPQVLSNLGLSYALQRQMPMAEDTLRQAAAQPQADMRVRQNLALVLALEGKFDDAVTISQRDMSPVDAADNVESIKRMIAQSDQWKGLGRSTHHATRKVAAAPRGDRIHTAAIADPQ